MKQLFSFRGRMGRAKFAMVFMAGLALVALAVFLSRLLLRAAASSAEIAAGAMLLKVFAHGIEAMVLWCVVWILSASWTKRLHDIGVSGWYQLILLVPFVKYLLLVVFFIPGAESANKYGEKV